jgi:hypothetical protein
LEDTSSLSNLNALLIQVSPKEVLTQRGGLSTEAARLLQNRMQSAATVTALTPGTEFPDCEDAAAALESKVPRLSKESTCWKTCFVFDESCIDHAAYIFVNEGFVFFAGWVPDCPSRFVIGSLGTALQLA